jgi:hypothetical protein
MSGERKTLRKTHVLKTTRVCKLYITVHLLQCLVIDQCFMHLFQSSRSILLAFSREYLKGEGDITKHLSYLGFSVTHEQVKYL